MILPSFTLLATVGANAAEQANVFAQVLESRGVVLAVLVVLVLLSLSCWFVIGFEHSRQATHPGAEKPR